VISTTLGAEGLEVEHGKHLLLADEAAAFARAILCIIDQPEVGQRLVDPAFRLVREQYDLGTAERQIGSVLERLGARPTTWSTP
jgi:glycosyltransferase involved in cell wall biosynthesis